MLPTYTMHMQQAPAVIEHAASCTVFYIYRDESRSEIKCCNPKNQIRDHPEKEWYLSHSGCGIKSGINTTFLARNCGTSVAPRAANSSCPLVVLASTSTCPRGSAATHDLEHERLLRAGWAVHAGVGLFNQKGNTFMYGNLTAGGFFDWMGREQLGAGRVMARAFPTPTTPTAAEVQQRGALEA